MPVNQNPSALIMSCADHHVAAAEHHERAAESHRIAAAQYIDGDYQQANENARLARNSGQQAEISCIMAMK